MLQLGSHAALGCFPVASYALQTLSGSLRSLLAGRRVGPLQAAASAVRAVANSSAQHAPPTSSSSTAAAAAAAAAAQPASEPKPIHVTVNGRPTELPAGSSLYDAVSKVGAFVPVLCKHPRLPNTPGSCRVCMVEVDGRLKPACCTPAWEGAVINTDTDEVKTTVTGTLTLLRANHPEDCMSCDVNGKCEFQDLITRYNSSFAIKLDLDKCIKCSRCVTTCEEVQGMNVLGMFNRGRDRHIGFIYETDLDLSKCIECGQCVSVCPVGALSENTSWREVLGLLQNRRKVMVAQTAPAVRVAIGEEAGMAPGSISTGQMVAGLKALGFDYVFDTDFAADLTIMEEGTELLHRLKRAWGLEQGEGPAPPLPMFTSCCPAWVNLVETDYPELIPHLSSCKSPQQMMGAVVKEVWCRQMGLKPEDVVMVSVMPCTAKKHEANRPEMGRNGCRDVDFVLTTRELGRLFRHNRINMASLPNEAYDSPMGTGSGAGVLFGNSGGVMEAAVRTVYEVVTGKELPQRLQLDAVRGLQNIKEAALDLELPDHTMKTVRVAVASGIASARELIEDIQAGRAQCDFVEVMSCPGGCIGGGGQPKTRGQDVLQKRMDAVYNIDRHASLRKSHDNPEVQAVYHQYFDEPNSHKSHKLLHTHYQEKGGEKTLGYSDSAKAASSLPPEVEAAKAAPSAIPGPEGGWQFQPLFRPAGYTTRKERLRRQLPG